MSVKKNDEQQICNEKLKELKKTQDKSIEVRNLVEMDLNHIWHHAPK